MRLLVYAGYLIDYMQLEAWSRAQTDATYVRCREAVRTGALVAIQNYLEIKYPTFPIEVNVFPYPEGETGKTSNAGWYTMFYLRSGDYQVHMRKFADWQKYERDESDARLMEIIDELGIPAYGKVKWDVVAWVGLVGLFYDFSPSVIEGMYERSRAYRTAKAQQAALQSDPPAPIAEHATNTVGNHTS